MIDFGRSEFDTAILWLAEITDRSSFARSEDIRRSSKLQSCGTTEVDSVFQTHFSIARTI